MISGDRHGSCIYKFMFYTLEVSLCCMADAEMPCHYQSGEIVLFGLCSNLECVRSQIILGSTCLAFRI